MSDEPLRQRVGIFGGTFDPIHLGHLMLAEQFREQLQLAEVRFIPAAKAPHKQDQSAADAKHRVEMIRLAIGGNSNFAIDERELKRGGTSYTVDTLRELKIELPTADLFFLMGADSLAELHTWREPQTICQLAFVAIIARGGQPPPDLQQLARFQPADQIESLANHLLQMPQVEISSTDIRRRAVSGQSIRYMVPAAVETYIRHNTVYS